MSRILSVYIEKNGKQEYVGKIVGDSSVDACFSYDDSYIEKNGKPISISLPLEEKAFDEKRTRYFFEGLLPVSQPHVQLVFDNPVLFSHYFHQESELHQDTHCQVQPKLKDNHSRLFASNLQHIFL